MISEKNLLQKVKESKKTAEKLIEQMKKIKTDESDYKQFESLLCRYIKIRFLLDFLPGCNDSIRELAAKSIQYFSGVSVRKIQEIESISSCSGAKTVAIKKVLLIVSLEKQLDKKIPISVSEEIEKIRDLARCLFYRQTS